MERMRFRRRLKIRRRQVNPMDRELFDIDSGKITPRKRYPKRPPSKILTKAPTLGKENDT
jgi:hypothetical protein